MGNQIKHRRLFRLTTSWMLAIVLAGGGIPAPALQELTATRTARADEIEEVPPLEVDEQNTSNVITEEAETSESEEPIIVPATEDDDERILTTQDGDEDEPSISFEGDVPNCLVVTDANDSVDLTLSTQNVEGLNIRWTVGLCVVDDWVNGHVFVEGREYSVDQTTNTLTLN